MAQASAAQLREGVAQAALVQVGATNAASQRVKAQVAQADAAAREAAAAAEKLAQLQLQATTDGTAALADKIEQGADLLAVVTPSGGSKPPRTKGGVPVWFTNLQAAVAKAGAKGDPNATDATLALDKLGEREIWATLRSKPKRDNMSAADLAELQKVEPVVTASQITLRSGSAIRDVMDQIRADGMAAAQVAAIPPTPATPIEIPPLPITPPATPAPAPQTESGLEASEEVPAWKLDASRAMDLAETGDQVGALRLLTKHAATMPEEKMAKVYAFIFCAARQV